MPLSRLLPLLIGLSLVLGLMIWLVHTVSRFYTWVSFTSPLLANILLGVLLALLVLLIGAAIYYVLLFQGSRSRRSRKQRLKPKVSTLKPEAAEETLQAVRQQVAQIQDEVARQTLQARSREIEADLARRELRVVVFGTGSAGKTSIVNALIGRMVGRVGAPMGTTEAGQTYNLHLKGLNREIWITDTPGILEASVAGTEREQMARQLATEADLLLFVVDDDLRQSEYQPLRALVQIGKRSLVVLNKIDRYSEADREAILAHLGQRVQGFIALADLVAVAARPQAFALENGETFQPDPEVMPLIKRMAAVLRTEGEELLADNILLQSQRLGEEARQIIDAQRRRQAEKVVRRFQWIGAGVIWITPLPVIDLLATAAVNAQMVIEIGKVYGCEINRERGRELAISLAKTLGSLGLVKGAIEVVSTALQFSVGGYVVGTAIQSVTAAYLTQIAGKSFIEYFSHDQDWGDGGITEVVQKQFQLNRRDEFIQTFIQEALFRLPKELGRVVKPFPSQREPQTLEAEEESDLRKL